MQYRLIDKKDYESFIKEAFGFMIKAWEKAYPKPFNAIEFDLAQSPDEMPKVPPLFMAMAQEAVMFVGIYDDGGKCKGFVWGDKCRFAMNWQSCLIISLWGGDVSEKEAGKGIDFLKQEALKQNIKTVLKQIISSRGGKLCFEAVQI